MSSRGPAPASVSPSRRISASVRSTPASTSLRRSGSRRRQRLHLARPVGVPVDRLAVLVQLRIGQQVGRAVAQAAAHDAAQLRRGVVQRLAAHAQGAHAAARGDDQRGLAGHSVAENSRPIMARAISGPTGFEREPRQGRQTAFAQSRSTNFWTLPVEVMGRSRNTT